MKPKFAVAPSAHAHAGLGAGAMPATASLRMAGLALSVQIDDLGLRGPSLPSALRNIRELQTAIGIAAAAMTGGPLHVSATFDDRGLAASDVLATLRAS